MTTHHRAAQGYTVAAGSIHQVAFDLQRFSEGTPAGEGEAKAAPSAADQAADTSTTADQAAAATKTPDSAPDKQDQQDQQDQTAPTDLLADYKPALPDGMTMDQAAFDQFLPVAKELGLSPDKADKLVGLYAQSAQALANRVVEDINSQCQTNYEAAITAIKADKAFGGSGFEANMGAVNAMLTKYGDAATPESFHTALTALAGVDKEAVAPLMQAFLKMAKDAAPDKTLLSAGGGAKKSLGELLYPNMTK